MGSSGISWQRRSARVLFSSLAALVISGSMATGAAVAFTPTITEYPTSGHNPWSLAAAGGELWFTDPGGEIGSIDPSTHSVSASSSGLNPGTSPDDMSIGPDQNVWFTDEGSTSAVGMVNPTTHVIHEYSSGLNPKSDLSGISPGADGNVWFTDFSSSPAIGVINPTTHVIHEYSSGLNSGSRPLRITPGPNGELWFTDQSTGTPAIGEINPITHAIHEYSVGLNSGSVPRGIAAGPDGNLWFTDNGATKAIGEINPTTHAITEYTTALELGSQPDDIAAGPDGNLWFTDSNSAAPAIGRINPASHAISEYTAGLSSGSTPIWITSGPDASMWFTDNSGAIGQVTTGASSTNRNLTVSLGGSGSGRVTSSPAGLACPGTCTHGFEFGTPVTLSAAAGSGSTFAGWGGPCTATASCTVMMTGPLTVPAKFTAKPQGPGQKKLAKPHGTRITKATISRKKHRASFRFKAAGTVTGFQCELIKPSKKSPKKHHKKHSKAPKAKFTACRSRKTYKHLKRGRYTFKVRAVNRAGADPQPATKRFRI
jgi:streptogramin lyase